MIQTSIPQRNLYTANHYRNFVQNLYFEQGDGEISIYLQENTNEANQRQIIEMKNNKKLKNQIFIQHDEHDERPILAKYKNWSFCKNLVVVLVGNMNHKYTQDDLIMVICIDIETLFKEKRGNAISLIDKFS